MLNFRYRRKCMLDNRLFQRNAVPYRVWWQTQWVVEDQRRQATQVLPLLNFRSSQNSAVLPFSSVYRDFLCYERINGKITILKLGKGEDGDRKLCEVTFTRIYSSNQIVSLHIWAGVATFLINNEVKTLKYDGCPPPVVSTLTRKARIKFTLENDPMLEYKCHIYRDDIILCTCKRTYRMF